MTMWMNEHEIDRAIDAAREHGEHGDPMPNALAGAEILERLARWTNNNSDGWHSWPKPGNASSKLGDALYFRFFAAHDRLIDYDLTDAELRATLTPIKAMLTRHGVSKEVQATIFERPAPLAIVATGTTTFHGAHDWDLGLVEEGQHDNPDEWAELCLMDPADTQPEYRTTQAILRLTTAGLAALRDQADTLLTQRKA